MTDLDIYNALVEHGWHAFQSLGYHQVKGLGKVQALHYYDHSDNPEFHYGEATQGWQGETAIVLAIDGRFFKKLGTADSYFRVTWDGKFFEVNPKIKEVTVYE